MKYILGITGGSGAGKTEVSNILREHGIKVLEMSSAELSRGRGGPRCMSMPLVREDLK